VVRVVEETGRWSLRDELGAVGFVPIASKLYRPSPGIVSRVELVARVVEAGADVITVAAPAGYGKSTFLAELVAADPRPAAWVSLAPSDDDATLLLTYIALALDEIERVDPVAVAGLWLRAPAIGSPLLQRFLAVLDERRVPFVLVLDDVHEVVSVGVLDMLVALVAAMPAGSTVVLAGRSAIPLPLGRLRARRRLVELGPTDLAFDVPAASRLFSELSVDVPATTIERLVERTDGWPVALHLAAVGTGSGGVSTVEEFGGDHRYVVEYLAEELIDRLDAPVAAFLMEAACFERVSGRLCDEVLERSGSAELLETVRSRNLLVLPLDDRREWYRFHQLMSEFLRTELARRDPVRRAAIHVRASAWFDDHGDADGAVTHALLGGDVERAASMVVRWYTSFDVNQMLPHTTRWLAMFPAHAIDSRPDLMIVAAWAVSTRGDATHAAVQWLDRAEASLRGRPPDDVEGVSGRVALARAILPPLTPEEMATYARYAYERVGVGDDHALSCLAWGSAALLLGDDVEARRRLREGADTTDRPIVVALCLAHLALVEVARDDWEAATIAARRARTLLGDTAANPATALVVAVAVMVETHAGRGDAVEAERLMCRQHLTYLVDAAHWVNLTARLALARAALIQGNRVEAAALLDEATKILEVTPSAVGVAKQFADLQRQVAMHRRSPGFGPSSLTTAELRVLQLLPTHLSVAEIADRLYVSRNTVKSQTISIYRKLGTSSRHGAVEIANAAGLLGMPARHS
jgi:LuxR family maltose regulon positive regulatory protein